MSQWYLDFREKGPDARVGGFYRADDDHQRDEITAHLRSFDLKVEWSPVPDRRR